jgi:hypothetical protein
VTSLVLAWRALGRTLGRAFATGAAGRAAIVSDDLIIGAD